MLWRQPYSTRELNVHFPDLCGHSLSGEIFDPSSVIAWVAGIGALVDFVREIGTWDRLMADAFPSQRTYARGVLRPTWDPNQLRALQDASPPSQFSSTFAWHGALTVEVTNQETMIAHVPATGLTLIGQPTEDAWERFHAEMLTVLSG